ncbi:gluconokinase [Niabella aurantiaca]|uniref:gluconokinase n=1 Tax=Niabella aurantiaca TaxID=379900 RepID=UPI00036CBBB2|nr:gluconokinase [Niabella aurantiaca]
MAGRSIIIMGVSGSGKTTVGKAVAGERGYRFLDGDDLHPPANIEKMQSGIPLTDEDRWGWLLRINREMQALNATGISVVIACSALKRSYRDLLRQGGVQLLFVYLKASFQQISQLLRTRTGHFMPAGLLQSQFATLEEPTGMETDCIAVPVTGLPEELDRIGALLIRNGF